jgi:hypothetical protein
MDFWNVSWSTVFVFTFRPDCAVNAWVTAA